MNERCVCCGAIVPEGRQVCPRCESKPQGFNKPPEWGSRFHFPENVQLEYAGFSGSVASKILVEMAEKYDNFVVEQIAMTARANGVSDCTVLNKAAIMEALERRTPKKPVDNGWLYCPVCGRDVLGDHSKFCPDCGQAIDWEDC